MNLQTENWIADAIRYADEFVKELDPIEELTDKAIEDLASEQARFSVEQAANHDLGIAESDEEFLQAMFYDVIRKARTSARIAQAKPTTRTSGPNIWATRWGFDIAEGVQLPDDPVYSLTRPSDEHFPCVSYRRVKGYNYIPYQNGSVEWLGAANKVLASKARANFEKGQK